MSTEVWETAYSTYYAPYQLVPFFSRTIRSPYDWWQHTWAGTDEEIELATTGN